MTVSASDLLITYQIRTRAYEDGVSRYPRELYLAAKRLVAELEALAPTEEIGFENNEDSFIFRVKKTGRELARIRKSAFDDEFR